MAFLRERSPGRWEVRIYTGRDPLTGRKLYNNATVRTDPGDRRTAERKAAVLEDELLTNGRRHGEAENFGQLLDAYLDIARMSPGTRKQTDSLIDRYLSALRPLRFPIRTHTLDAFFAALEQRGGRCTQRPCPRQPCPGHPGRHCTRTDCKPKPCPGHPGANCLRPYCVRPPCPTHKGACATWTPCEDRPCAHGAPLAASTVKRVHGVVHAAFKQAVVWDWARDNPAEHCRLSEVDPTEEVVPELEDVVRLLVASEAVDPRLAVYELVSASSGARRGAVHAARLGDIDLDTGRFDFPLVCVDATSGWEVIKATRTKRSGRGTLDPYTLAAVRWHVAQLRSAALAAGRQLPDDAFLFSDDPTGSTSWKPAGCWKPGSTTQRVLKIRRANDLGHVRLKGLRNWMPTQLLDAGVSPRVVAERGGWRKVETMLNIYARTTTTGDQAAAEAMGTILSGAFGTRPAADVG